METVAVLTMSSHHLEGMADIYYFCRFIALLLSFMQLKSILFYLVYSH